jgi:hypothetical protein
MIQYETPLKAHKSIDLTMIKLARRITYSLGYLHAKTHGTTFLELIIRTPFMEIAQARKWECEYEFRLPNDPSHKKAALKK